MKSQYTVRDYKPRLEAAEDTSRTTLHSSRRRRVRRDNTSLPVILRGGRRLSSRCSTERDPPEHEEAMAVETGRAEEYNQRLHVEFEQLNLDSDRNEAPSGDPGVDAGVDAGGGDDADSVQSGGNEHESSSSDRPRHQRQPSRRQSAMSHIDEEDAALSHSADHTAAAGAINAASYIDTSSKSNVMRLEKRESSLAAAADEKKAKLITVPPFVQLESLHAGKVFVCTCTCASHYVISFNLEHSMSSLTSYRSLCFSLRNLKAEFSMFTLPTAACTNRMYM